MKWTLTIKEQTFGVHTDVNKYECRVTRTGRDVRLSVQNLSAGPLREGRFWMPTGVARHLGHALLLSCWGEGDRTAIALSIEEGKGKK